MRDVLMMSRSPFDGVALPHGVGGSVAEAPPACRFSFRGDRVAADVMGRAFGVALPSEVCRAAKTMQRAALWLGPDEWLLIAHDASAAELQRELTQAMAGIIHSLVDISGRNVGLVISGANAAAWLNAFVLLDLDLQAFPVGMCTRTVFAKADIVLWRTGDERFHIELWRSFASYVHGLLDAASTDIAT